MAEARDLAYTTVTTILYRLHRKGLAARQLSGRGNAYRAAQDEAARAPRRCTRCLAGDTTATQCSPGS